MSFMTDISSGAVKGLIDGVTDATSKIKTMITGKLPPEQQAQIDMEIIKLENALILGQMEVNKIEASNPNLFVSGWRPAAGWVCVSGFGYEFLIRPWVAWISGIYKWPLPPSLETNDLMTVLTGLLGLGIYRTYEKVKGVSRS